MFNLSEFKDLAFKSRNFEIIGSQGERGQFFTIDYSEKLSYILLKDGNIYHNVALFSKGLRGSKKKTLCIVIPTFFYNRDDDCVIVGEELSKLNKRFIECIPTYLDQINEEKLSPEEEKETNEKIRECLMNNTSISDFLSFEVGEDSIVYDDYIELLSGNFTIKDLCDSKFDTLKGKIKLGKLKTKLNMLKDGINDNSAISDLEKKFSFLFDGGIRTLKVEFGDVSLIADKRCLANCLIQQCQFNRRCFVPFISYDKALEKLNTNNLGWEDISRVIYSGEILYEKE